MGTDVHEGRAGPSQDPGGPECCVIINPKPCPWEEGLEWMRKCFLNAKSKRP